MKGGTKRLKRSKDGKYHCGDVVAKMGIGSVAKGWHDTACKTSGGLIKKDLVKEAMEIFFDVRKVPGLKKKPSTSELIDWLKLLMADDIPEEILTNRDTTKAIPPLYGALVKNEQDVQLLERLAFMNRRQSNTNSSGQ